MISKLRIRIQLFIILIITTLSTSAIAQKIGFDEIDDSKVGQWMESNPEKYLFVYHFGDSEMESDLILLYSEGWHAQIRSGSWNDDGTAWVWNYMNINNVRIDKNKFYSDRSNGEFVTYNDGKEIIKGLKLYEPWSGMTEDGEYEIGTKSYPVSDYFSGTYPQASLRLLSEEELLPMSKLELKIMRNEIFARYGYRFKPAGEMDMYFRMQTWYKPTYENIDEFLTDIERKNIAKIISIEQM